MKEKIWKAFKNPFEAVRVLRGIFTGFTVKIWYRFTNPNVSIGKRFRAYSWLYIRGPGKVFIGDNVSVTISFLRSPSILTHLPESTVKIDNEGYIGGTRISCVGKIEIGKEALLGSVTIIDSDIIPIPSIHIDADWKNNYAAPIRVGSHFWAGNNSFILKGADIGDECVLSAGSVAYNKTFPSYSLLMGNPARKIGQTRNE